MMVYLLIIAGLVLLLIGGETLVKGSVDVARRLNVPPLVVGIVLVGLGTSMPELVTCIKAAMAGVPDMAVGNVIGSNIANILLVVGVSAVCAPIVTPMKAFKRDGTALVLFTAIFVGLCFTGFVGREIGAVFILLLGSYIIFSYKSEKKNTTAIEADVLVPETSIDQEHDPRSIMSGLMMTFGGIAMTVWGADFLVDGATEVARQHNISDAVIGLTIVAIGTSLPELVTGVIAGLRGHSDVSLGNIIGSNIYNMLGILGTTAVVKPLTIPQEVLTFDIWVMVAATVLMVMVPLRKQRISRNEGMILASCYVLYLFFLYSNGIAAG